jgi:hypothetical protein
MMQTSPVYLDDLLVAPRLEEVYRLLGGTPDDAPARLQPLVEEALTLGRELAKPHAVYALFHCVESDPALKNDLGPIVLGICTIGSALEEKVRELTAENQLALATTLDAVGSETVENLAEQLEARICREFTSEEQVAGARFSPGYGNWPLASGQRTVFSLLPGERIGVTLSTTSLMRPLKSISFAMKLSASPSGEPSPSKCSLCDKQDCPYRR